MSRKSQTPQYSQADGSFIIDTNYALEIHQLTLVTDEVPTAGTAKFEIDTGLGIFQKVYSNGSELEVDLTAIRPLELPVQVDNIKVTLTDFDADKLVGYTLYSRNY